VKAVILAAGKGLRLGDLTRKIPKPMMKIHGKPILEHNILLCKKYGIEDIYINLHHLPDIIVNCFGNGSKYGISINYQFEPEILGTAGALISFLPQLMKKPFFVIYGDNYTNTDLESLSNFHHENKSDFTIAMHHCEDIEQSGVLEFSDDGKITKFLEKPCAWETHSRWINAGVYIICPEIIKDKLEKGLDFGKDIIPSLVKSNFNVFGFRLKKRVIAIDTLKMFQKQLGVNQKMRKK
jgi:NDP-sugar pyrophosphorylase family protein